MGLSCEPAPLQSSLNLIQVYFQKHLRMQFQFSNCMTEVIPPAEELMSNPQPVFDWMLQRVTRSWLVGAVVRENNNVLEVVAA